MIHAGGKVEEVFFGETKIKSVYVGSDLVWSSLYEPEVHELRQPGIHRIYSPSWAKFVDFVLIGGGGGGACGDNSWRRSGNGGQAGEVKYGTLPLSGRMYFAATVGAGGLGGQTWEKRGGSNGAYSSIYSDVINETASGGRGGSGFGGAAAGARQNIKVDGFYLPAGSPADVDVPGGSPGDGGGGGSGGILGNFSPGQPGANGLVWLRFRSS